jgi:replicative superfamily II helicase
MVVGTLEDALRATDGNEVASTAQQNYLARLVASKSSAEISESHPRGLVRFAYAYEVQAISQYESWMSRNTKERRDELVAVAQNAFSCWRALKDTLVKTESTNQPNKELADAIYEEIGYDPRMADIEFWFHLAATGTLCESLSETRLELRDFRSQESPYEQASTWREDVLWHVLFACILLTRKGGGWNDVNLAVSMIQKLRDSQSKYEEDSLNVGAADAERISYAFELAGLYHMAQIVGDTCDYIKSGSPSASAMNARIDRHRDNARDAFLQSRSSQLAHYLDLVWISAREMVRNSIWTHTNSLGEKIRLYVQYLTNKPAGNVLELWPSQQAALKSNMLDPYRRAIVVQMPTSAGKTLLAKFSIVQTKALNPDGRIAYIVPTRALVNQVTFDLRTDLTNLGIRVEQAVPAFEIDPTESRLLSSDIDVLVTTPEKLDLLLRKDHEATRNLALVVVDEAHNLNDPERGARLELLLGMIRRDRPNSRFLLLSPFIPNAEDLVAWIGNGEGLPPIHIEWKPSKHIIGSLEVTAKKEGSSIFLETLPAIRTDFRPGVRIPVGSLIEGIGRSEGSIGISGAMALKKMGSVLILCKDRPTCVRRAVEISRLMNNLPEDSEVEAVCAYIIAEMGREVPLVDCLRKGVAYHNAGLSQEVRWLIETLIVDRKISIICGTTTLAQGVNFPIAAVLVETLRKGRADLTRQDFWNVTGRAGRTLMDHTGVVAFPLKTREKREKIEDFLRKEAEDIVSQLTLLVKSADEVENAFDLTGLRTWPSLSPFLQFLAHAMHIAKSTDIAAEVEDLLRASLVYHQEKAKGPENTAKLVSICRAYLNQIAGKRNILGLADQTGFSTPSVLKMLYEVGNRASLKSPYTWKPSVLFSSPGAALSERISAIAELPEMKLGRGYSGVFDPRRVAAILIDWVNGESLDSLARKHPSQKKLDPESELDKMGNYLFSSLVPQASWGLGALQAACLDEAQVKETAGLAYVPSMIFFGVNRPEAVWFRMAGVPRLLASGVSKKWQSEKHEAPESYSQLRNWITGLSAKDWGDAIPKGVRMTPDQCASLWRRLSCVH